MDAETHGNSPDTAKVSWVVRTLGRDPVPTTVKRWRTMLLWPGLLPEAPNATFNVFYSNLIVYRCDI